MPVSKLEIKISAGGKPYCPQAQAAGLSSSHSYAPPHACLVVGHGSRIGIDIERVVYTEPTWNLLEHVFTEMELQQWLQLPAGELRCRAFTAAWTLKEAVLKARGTGLAEPPQSVGVTFSADGHVMPATPLPLAWQSLNLAPGHAAALVLLS